MIEINLLPEEHRRDETNQLPLFVTVVVGLITCLSLGAGWVTLATSLRSANQENETLQAQRAEWKKKADYVDKLAKEIKTNQKRQETIINISRSKIMWSQKLVQMSKIFGEYDQFWVESMNMSQGSDGKGNLLLVCKALGKDGSQIADFRDSLKKDTTFFYHFENVENKRFQTVEGTNDIPDHLSFTIRLDLRGQTTKKKKGKKP